MQQHVPTQPTAAPESDEGAAAPPDPLERERAHLRHARAALRGMREEYANLDLSDVGANWVNNEVLRGSVQRRVEALADLSDLPLFFGRIDHAAHQSPAQHTAAPDDAGTETTSTDDTTRDGAGRESYYIGRRHVHDADGDPMVLDWRAPVSEAFYQASQADPRGLTLRRRFGYTGGELTAYEDEHLDDSTPRGPATAEPASALLTAEIERPRVGPMRDIVATIQPDQDAIVRSDIGQTLCVQGAPGTGKTAVGLHRVAYLLYTHRERLKRTGCLVVGPNRSFLHYIEQVLPALGELRVAQATVEELVGELPVRREAQRQDSAAAATVKGDARMARVLRRAVFDGVRMPDEALLVARGSRRWRVPAHELAEMVRELLERDMRYGAAREALPRRFAHAVLVRMEAAGEAPDDRTQDAVARNASVKALVKQVWPAIEPERLLLRLFSEPEFLARCADGVLREHERAALLWSKPARGVRSAPWAAADAVLLDEVRDLVYRTPSLGHVVLDEAQDLSPMQYRAVGRRCGTGSATVLGDLAQGTTPWATGSWPEALGHLGKSGAALEELTRGFRVPAEVLDYASRLLPHIASGLTSASSLRTTAGALRVRRVDEGAEEEGDGAAAVPRACREALLREGSVGLIAAADRVETLARALDGAGIGYRTDPVPGEDEEPERLTLLPADLAKGLEFDQVVLDEPAAIVQREPDRRTGLRRLYVCLTRAVSGLTVLHAHPLPEELG